MTNKKDAAVLRQRYRDRKQGTLYISSGLPGSGKTTWLRKNVRPNSVVVSRDDIRFSILKEGEAYFSHEEEVFNTFTNEIVENLLEGRNVYADATHLTPYSQIKLLAQVLLDSAPPQIDYIFFNIPIDICLERNEKRKGTKTYVPKSVIRKMKETSDFRPCFYIDNSWIIDKDGNVSKWEVEY